MNGIPPEVGALIALFNEKRYAECEAQAKDMIRRMPQEGFAWKILGASLKLLGRMEEALVPMKRATELWPLDPETHRNLGNLLYDLGRFGEAEASLRQAVALKPFYAEAQANLGNTLRELGRFAEAEAVCRRALAANPNLALAHRSLVFALRYQGKQEEAKAAARLALERNPDDARLRLLQMTAALPIVAQNETESSGAADEFDSRLSALSEWAASPGNRAGLIEAAGLDQPFYLAYRPGNHAARLSRYGDLIAESATVSAPPAAAQRKKCRLAIVSQYFRSHSVWHIILEGLLTHLDRERFEIALYHTGHDEDAQTAAARSLADIWRDGRTVTGLPAWLRAIREDHPDAVLYPEIGMDPVTLGMAARRLAPLQAASWGHPVTTGLPTIDLYFSGELLEAPEADTHYRERLVRLPGTGCCTMPAASEAEPASELSSMLASRKRPLFLVAQLPAKLDPADDMLYARIAEAAGGGTFIFFSDPKFPWATERIMARIGRAFAERRLSPSEHLFAAPWLSRPQFHAMLDLCDVYLDCPGFSGYTTAWQAARLGIPVVTLEGGFLRQRLAAGLLRKMGVTDTIASSADEYVALAARLAREAQNAEQRSARRARLRAAASSADNDADVVRAFEQTILLQLARHGITFA